MCLSTKYLELSPVLCPNVSSHTRGRAVCHSWRIWASLYSEKISLKITSLEAPTEKHEQRGNYGVMELLP